MLSIRRVYFQIVFSRKKASKKREFIVNKSKCTLQIASETPLVLIGKAWVSGNVCILLNTQLGGRIIISNH